MNATINSWNQIYTSGITTENSITLNTPDSADDQVILSNSEDDLHKRIYTIQNLEHVELSAEKWNKMEFQQEAKLLLINKCLKEA